MPTNMDSIITTILPPLPSWHRKVAKSYIQDLGGVSSYATEDGGEVPHDGGGEVPLYGGGEVPLYGGGEIPLDGGGEVPP